MKNRIFLIGGIGAVLALGYLKNESATGLNAISDNVSLSNCEIVQVAAGTDHNLALDKDGNLWAWGRNDHGQLGDGTTTNSNVPKQIYRGHKFSKISAGNNCSAAIDTDGFLYGWGSNINPTKVESFVPTLISDADRYSDVLCNYNTTLALKKSDARVCPFGYTYFHCERGNYMDYNTVWELDTSHSPAIISRTSTRIYAKSYNYSVYDFETLSYEKAVIDVDGVSHYLTYVPYGSGGQYRSINCYYFFVLENGKIEYKHVIKAENATGKYEPHSFFDTSLDLSPLDSEFIKGVSIRKVMDSDEGTAYFVSDTGKIYAVGDNGNGDNYLGNPDYLLTARTSTPVQVQSNEFFTKVCAGKNHVLAIDNKGKVYSWGNNAYGQLGDGTYKNKATPTLIQTLSNTKAFDFTAYSGEVLRGSFENYGATNYSVIDQGKKGKLTLDSKSGDFEYSPLDGEYGQDTLLIKISYGSLNVDYQVNIFIDRKPVFTGGTSSFNVECGQSFDGSAPAIDADGDDLTYSIYETPNKGRVVLNGSTGSFTYTAGLDMAGGDTFIIAVSDGYCTAQYPVSVHVQSLITYSDNTDIQIDLLSGPTYTGNIGAVDIDGDTLSYSVKKNGSKGSATIDSLGNYTYTARGDFYGQDSFVIEVDDGYKPLEVTYNVHLYSVADSGTTLAAKITKGTVYNGTVQTNANGVEPAYSIQIQPKNGSVSIDSKTGEYSYTPNMGSSGDDSFVVLVDYDYGQYTLTIHVYQNEVPNNALVAKEIVVQENVNYNGSAQCTDTDGDLLRYAVKTQPLKGSISLNPTTGKYTYYPNENVAGDDSFEINVDDGTDTITNFISVHIESEISVNSNIQKSISQNASLSGNVGASDKDGDTLTYSILRNAEHGIASVDSLSGDYVYVPNNNYFGIDNFEVKVDDGVLPKVVLVTVNVNRRPVANEVSIMLETEGVTVTGTAACSDPDGDTLTYSLVSQPAQGNVIVNSSNGGFAYTPNADAHGDDCFQIKVTDGCDEILVSVTVHNETAVTLKEQNSTIVVNQGKSTTGQVLAVDLDGDELTYSVLNYPAQGIVNLNSSTGAWTFNAKATAKGRDSFKVQVTDGKTVAVLEYTLIINSPAAFEHSSYSFNTNQNSNYTGVVRAIDSDGDSLRYSIVSQGTKGVSTIDPLSGRYQYAPATNQAGDDTFVIGVSDGNFTTEVEVNVHIETDIVLANATLTVEVPKNDIVTGNVNASDADGDLLVFSVSKQGEKGNANVMGDGSFSYCANIGAGDDSFVISVTDGIHTSYVAVYVHISTEPYFEENSISISVPQNGSTTGTVHGVDEDGDHLTYSISSKPTNGTVDINGVTGAFTYTAYSNSTATSDSFVVSVTDGQTTKQLTVSVVINNAPETTDMSISVGQGKSGFGRIDASDPEDDTLKYSISSQGTHGSASINSTTGEFVYTCGDKGFYGTDAFVVAVSDGYSVKNVVVTVNVIENSKPISKGATIELNSASTASGQLDVSDPEGDALTYSISAQGDKGTARINEQTGEYIYSSFKDTSGYDCFVVTISDGFNTTSYLVEININFVDSNNSWAIPTTIVTGSLATISIGGFVFVLIKMLKAGKAR